MTKLAAEIAESEEEQRKSGLSKEEFGIFWILRSYKIDKPGDMAKRICKNIESYGEWLYNEKIERELRTELYKVLLESRKPVHSRIKDRDRIMEEAIYEPGHLKELMNNIKLYRTSVVTPSSL